MPMHSHLKDHLDPVARRQRRLRLWRKLAWCWGTTAVLGLCAVALHRSGIWSSALTLPLIALAGAVAGLIIVLRNGRVEPDWRAIARQIEVKHPELDGRLLTAVQQEAKPDGPLNYLQERLVREAALHGLQNEWTEIVPGSRLFFTQALHLLAILFLLAVLLQLNVTTHHTFVARKFGTSGITVTPGDT